MLYLEHINKLIIDIDNHEKDLNIHFKGSTQSSYSQCTSLSLVQLIFGKLMK